MHSDYILKGRGQLALHKPDWVSIAPSAPAVASSAAPATSGFEAAVKAHDAAYETVKHTSTSSKGTHRYAKAEAITDQLNKAPSRSASTRDVVEQPAEPSSEASSEIGEDGSLYPERNKSSATKMNAFNHSGVNKKTVGPGVDTVDYTMEDFLDTINPLQQIPIVNMIYRNLTGDKISGVAQVMGSALFWGPTGIITGAVDAIFEQEKGGDMGETIMAGILGTETRGAKDLPSNKLKLQAQETMLADASNINNSATVAASQTPSVQAPTVYNRLATKEAPAKQPFGGVMGNEQPRVANVTNSHIANDDDNVASEVETAEIDPVDAESARILATATPAPVTHKPVEADGHKMFSLAGVPRHPSVASHMPLRDMPDVRLKTYGKEIAKSTPAGTMKDGAGLLGLQKPAAELAADIPATVLPDPSFSAPIHIPAANGNMQTPSGNQIPAQLIQDMMLMNMQKYQDGLKNGTRGSSLDING